MTIKRSEDEPVETGSDALWAADVADRLDPEALARVRAAAYLTGHGDEPVIEAQHQAELLDGLTVEDIAKRFRAEPVDDQSGGTP
jgi:hypothetical protein